MSLSYNDSLFADAEPGNSSSTLAAIIEVTAAGDAAASCYSKKKNILLKCLKLLLSMQ